MPTLSMPRLSMQNLKIGFNAVCLAGLAYAGFRGAELADSNARLITVSHCTVTDKTGHDKSFAFPATPRSGAQAITETIVDGVTSFVTGKSRPENQTREGAMLMDSHYDTWTACRIQAEMMGDNFSHAYAQSELFEKNSLLMQLVDPATSTTYGQQMELSGKLTPDMKTEWAKRAEAVEQTVRILQGPPAARKGDSIEMRGAKWAVGQAAASMGL